MTGPVDQGQTFRYRIPVHDSAGVLANAGTVVVTITLPDGTTSTPAVVNTSTGLYDIAYLTTQVGLHQLSGSATGGVLGSEFDLWSDAFTVEEPARLLIGVDEAMARLRASGVITSDADREQLRWLCLVASAAVERDLNRTIVRRTITATYDGGQETVQLYSLPVLSITTVTESGTTVTAGGYTLARSGLLYRGGSTSVQSWAYGWQNIVVTYVAGYLVPPTEVREVALGTVQELWQASQQAPHPLLDEDIGLAVQSAASLLPGPQRAAYNRLRISL